MIRFTLFILLFPFILFASASGQNVRSTSAGVSPDSVWKIDSTRTVRLYFRFDKYSLERDYMSNPQSIAILKELLSDESKMFLIDSLVVTAAASPEGNVNYNQRLALNRVNAAKNYLLTQFPHLQTKKIVTHSIGEDWDGLEEFARNDLKLPYRQEVIKIIEQPISSTEKERRIRKLDNGNVFKYLNRGILRQLRAAGMCLIVYSREKIEQAKKLEILTPVGIPIAETQKPGPKGVASPQPSYGEKYIRPFALKTNLLFDVATLFNIEAEIPLGKHFSILGEWTFPWWGGLEHSKRHNTLQMLSGGAEARYWFRQGPKMQKRNARWKGYNPLCGWFVGLYGGGGLYDFQFGGDGIQGEFYIAMGLSGGFAHPIGKHFHMEYSLGVGYLRTEFRHYTPIDNHKVWEYNGRQTWVGPTKAKISLVWIPQFKVKQKKGGMQP